MSEQQDDNDTVEKVVAVETTETPKEGADAAVVEAEAGKKKHKKKGKDKKKAKKKGKKKDKKKDKKKGKKK